VLLEVATRLQRVAVQMPGGLMQKPLAFELEVGAAILFVVCQEDCF
jgi:hypothetical protein